MTPADERHESMDVMRGIGNGVMGGLVIASPLLLLVAWLGGWFG